jgi:hypothetical protein
MASFQRDRLALVQERLDALAEQVKSDCWGPMVTAYPEHVDDLVDKLLFYCVKQRRRASRKHPIHRTD